MGYADFTVAEVVSHMAEGMLRYELGGDRWWFCKRELPDGRTLHLVPATYNLRLTLSERGDTIGWKWGWCFHDYIDAWAAALAWDGEGEPIGWIRELHSGRRRPDGDPEQEYVAP